MRLTNSKWLYIIGFVLVLLPCAQVLGSTAQWSNGYTYRRAITIDHTKVQNTDQTNFPVLISGTYSYLATTSNNGNVMNANGYDIIFTSDGAGTNILPYQRDSYNASTGAVNFWVQIPTASHTSDTVFYIFYGNSSISADQSQPSQTWDSNYRGVWHLPNGTTLTGNDSTNNANNGTDHGATAATGQIDGAASFNGTSEYLDLGTSSTLEPSGAITVSAWIKASTTQLYFPIIMSDGDSTGITGYNLYLQNDSNQGVAAFIVNVGGWGPCYVYGSTSLKDNSWHYLTGVYTGAGGTIKIYVDGGLGSSGSCANQSTNYGTSPRGEIGWKADQKTTDDFNGVIDEVRVSASARSADWISAEYNNQHSPSTFYAIASAADTQGSNSYSYSRPITIDHTKVSNTDQPSFPALISGTYAYLATTANGGNVTNSNGYDIIFTSDPAGANPLPFERESYNASTGAIILWVQVPIVSHSSDTVFYMFYGNSSVTADQAYNSGVWDSYFKGIWHMGNGTTLSTTDSTINSHNASLTGSPTAVAGQISGAANFSGTSDMFTISSIPTNGVFYTISAWLNTPLPTPSGGWNTLTRGANDDHAVIVQGSDSQLGEYDGVTGFHGCGYHMSGLASGWHYLVAVGSNSVTNFYIDGSYTCQANIKSNDTITYLGNGLNGSQQFGKTDEIRVSTGVARSSDWIAAEYNNQSSPLTFYTIGAVNSGGPDSWGPTITSLSPGSGSVDTPITISGTNFGSAQNGGIVNFNGVLATVTSWSNTSIVALVPDGATSGNVTVRTSGVTSNAASFTVTGPVISTLSPTQGPVGTSVVITGTGFGSSQGSSTVKFNGTAAAASIWSSTSITVTVPTGATSGGVIVTVSNVASDDAPFTVTGSAPSTSDIYYYFSDALGTARVITASDGTVCYDADLYPYGGIRAYNSTCGPSQVFTTYERDPESNNDYAMVRYFSSRLGRFMSPDPTGIFLGNLNDPQQLNLYSRVRNNPLNLTDPSGLSVSICVGDCGGFDFPIDIGFGWGGGGGGDWGWGAGPSGPSYTPPNVGTNPNPPNGSSASDDPFGGETFTNAGTDSPFDPLSILLPPGLGCDLSGCDFRRVRRSHHPINGQWPTSWLMAAWLATHWPFGSPKGKWWPSKGTPSCSEYGDSGRGYLTTICSSLGDGPHMDSVRGCLLEFYNPTFSNGVGGYENHPGLSGEHSGWYGLNGSLGIAAHTYCIPEGTSNP